jgi:uncharacterized protein YdhG (YjbR/CyaY superfamily)
MTSSKRKPTTIDQYLANTAAGQRTALQRVRRAIHAAAPGAEEYIGYGLAGFRLKGRPLVYFGAWANHCAFYPGSSTLTKKFAAELKSFATSKGTIRFTVEKPLPVALVKKIVQARIAENANR